MCAAFSEKQKRRIDFESNWSSPFGCVQKSLGLGLFRTRDPDRGCVVDSFRSSVLVQSTNRSMKT